MESRFTFKDFVFVVLFVIVIGAVFWSSFQYSYQEGRLNDVKQQLNHLDDTQKQQLGVLTEIRNQLRNGVSVSTTAAADSQGRIRRKNPDGSIYVYYPTPPKTTKDPIGRPDYSMGDWLVLNMGTEPKVIEPLIEKDLYGQLAQAPVMEGLVTQNLDTFEHEPLLAESYEISGDGLTYRFTLRKNINFSDGVPITADDVVFSFNTIMTPGVDCAPLRSYMSSVKGCTKIDDRTVEFKMTEPYFGALNTLGLMLILPQHVYKFDNADDYNRHGDRLVGSGPYLLPPQGWQRGQQLVYQRNEKYWGEKPTFDRLIFKFIQNPQASQQALLDGQLDSLQTELDVAPTPDQFSKFSTDQDFLKKFQAIKYSRPTSGYSFIAYNEARPMFKDKQTRQALAMLLDRDAIVHSIILDMGVTAGSSFSPLTPQHDPAVKPLPYDVEAAKKKLTEAGWKAGPDGILVRNGVRFEFELSMGSGNPVAERIANYVKEQFAHAGISMRITPWEFAVMMGRIDDRNFDAVTMGWSAIVEDDPYQSFHSSSIADKGSNFVQFNNPESDKLIEEARRTMDRDKRMELWHKWERLIADEQPYTFLYSRMDRAFIDKRFQNTEPYKMGLNIYDWYVPAQLQKNH